MDQEFAMWLALFKLGRQVKHMTRSFRTIYLAVALVALIGPLSGVNAMAQAVVATGQSFITARLLPGKVLPGGGRMAGLRLSMEPGWKTYWRSPGETGIPPRFDWSKSENIQSLTMHWPRPTLFDSFGMQTAGYGDVVLFPIELTPTDPARPMQVNLKADLGVCRDICVLETVSVALAIAPEDPEIGGRQIRSALRRVPKEAEISIVRIAGCDITGTGRDRNMSVLLELADDLEAVTVLMENTQGIWIRRTEQLRTSLGLQVIVDFSMPKQLSWVDRSAFRMTVLADGAAYDLHGCRAG